MVHTIRQKIQDEERQVAFVIGKSTVERLLHGDPEFNPVVRRMDEILLGSEIPFGGLDRCVPEQ